MGERAGDAARDVLTTGTWRATPNRPAISGFGTSRPVKLERLELTEVSSAHSASQVDSGQGPELEGSQVEASGVRDELLDDPDGQPDGEPDVKKDGPPVNRDVKLAVLLGFCAIVAVGVLVAEHFSKARSAEPATTELGTSTAALPQTPASTADPITGMMVPNTTEPQVPVRPSIFEMGRPAVDVEKGLGITLGPSEPSQAMPQATVGLGDGMIVPVNPTSVVVPAGFAGSPSSGGSAQGAGRGSASSAVVVVPEPSRDSSAGSAGVREDGDTFLPGSSGPSVRPEPTVQQPELVKDGSHPVQPGETLDRIARKHYGDRALAKALGEYNKTRLAKDGTLRAGVTLRIPPVAVLRGGERPAASGSRADASVTPTRPGRSEEAARPSRSGSTDPSDATGSTGPSAPKFYTVRRGDTLMDIAKETLGTSKRFREILKANPGLDEKSLKVGMKIRIPQASTR
jgi:nucleoid-associated protein YgaU